MESEPKVQKVTVELTPAEAALLHKLRSFTAKEGESTVRVRTLGEICLPQPSPSQGAYRAEFVQNLGSHLTGAIENGPWKKVPPGVVLDLYASDVSQYSTPSSKFPHGRVEKVSDKTPLTPIESYEGLLAAEAKKRRDMSRLGFFKDQANLSVREQAEYDKLMDEYSPEKGLASRLRNVFKDARGKDDDQA